MIQYWGKGGGKSHFFLLILYNFKNIGGGGGTWPSRSPPSPRSLSKINICSHSISPEFACLL